MKRLYMKYFVLKPSGSTPYAFASREAMKKYADVIFGENPDLSRDLYRWVRKEAKEALRIK